MCASNNLLRLQKIQQNFQSENGKEICAYGESQLLIEFLYHKSRIHKSIDKAFLVAEGSGKIDSKVCRRIL